jgi:hypothetical protein
MTNQYNGTNYQEPMRSVYNDTKSGDYVLPACQRYPDTWTKYMEEQFIVSLHLGIIPAAITINKTQSNRSKLISPTLCTTNTKTIKSHVIDGGHRLHTILKFRNNQVRFEGKFYSELDEDSKSKIDDARLSITRYDDLSQEQEEILFKQLNIARPLTAGEKMNGERSNKLTQLVLDIKEIYEDFTNRFSYQAKAERGMKYIPTIGSIIMQHVIGPDKNGLLKYTEVPSESKIDEFIERSEPLITTDKKNKVYLAFERMQEISNNVGLDEEGNPYYQLPRNIQNFISYAALPENEDYTPHVIQYLNLILDKNSVEYKNSITRGANTNSGTSFKKKWEIFLTWLH